MDYLQTDALSVGYNGKTLISKVALSVQRGRIVTLIGPNGSGKSTILKTIIGQLPSISGSVFLDGADMRSRSRGDVARRMAILMTARMDPELMTCRDVVSTGRYPYTGHLGVLRPEDKAIVEQSLPSSPSATASGSASCLPGPSASSRSSSSSTSRRVFSTSAISWSC